MVLMPDTVLSSMPWAECSYSSWRQRPHGMSVLPSPFGFGLWTAHFTPAILGAPCVLHERFSPEATLAAIRSSGWLLRFRELQRAVQEHVDQEENHVFPLARHAISPELAEEIDHHYKLEKTRAPM